MRRGFELAAYVWVIEHEPNRHSVYRTLIHDLPRRFHLASPAERRALLAERPALTGTKWDALLAAVVEHIARLHEEAVPAWVEEPERFLDTPWVISDMRAIGIDSVLYAPGSFIRHGALPDPLDLDARGGEKHAWVP